MVAAKFESQEMYFENFDIFDAKEIGINSRGRIWIQRESCYENFCILMQKR